MAGGETACALAAVAVLLFTLMVFSGVALTNVGPEALMEVPLQAKSSSSSSGKLADHTGNHHNGSSSSSRRSGGVSSSSSSSSSLLEYSSITIRVEFDVDNNGDLVLKRERGKLLLGGEERNLNNKGNGHSVSIPFDEVLTMETTTSRTASEGQQLREVLSLSQFFASRLGKGLEDCLFGDGLDSDEQYDRAAAVEWLHSNKFQWLCPNYYSTLTDKLHTRWQGALLRFLPQILFPPACIFANAVSSDAGFLVAVFGSAISALLMLTGIILEFSVLSDLNALLDVENGHSFSGVSNEFCNSGGSSQGSAVVPSTLGSVGFSPEMNGKGAPASAGLTFIPLLICIGIVCYVIPWSRCPTPPSRCGGGSSSDSDDDDDDDDESNNGEDKDHDSELRKKKTPSNVDIRDRPLLAKEEGEKKEDPLLVDRPRSPPPLLPPPYPFVGELASQPGAIASGRKMAEREFEISVSAASFSDPPSPSPHHHHHYQERNSSNKNTTTGDRRVTTDTSSSSPWIAKQAPDGRIFYQNTITKVRSWKKPDGSSSDDLATVNPLASSPTVTTTGTTDRRRIDHDLL